MKLFFCLLILGLIGGRPAPAPPTYVSQDKGLTFQSPAGVTHCPLGRGWGGSDHGTVLFLEPPEACGHAGYASSARNFKGDPPRIQIYYGLWFAENPPPLCVEAGALPLLGKPQPICKHDQQGKVIRTVYTRYSPGGKIELSVMLVTTPERAERDLATLGQFVASIRTCSTTYRDAKGKSYTDGEGPACPKGDIF